MSAGFELWPYVVLILVGFLPNEVWRMLGILVARGLDEDSELLVWVRAVATAVLAGVISQLVLTPPVGTSATRLVTLAHAGFLLPFPSAVSTGRGQAAMRSAARRRALLARGFSAISASVGVSDGLVTSRSRGERPQTQTGSSGGQMQPLRSASRNRFTIRSSSEW